MVCTFPIRALRRGDGSKRDVISGFRELLLWAEHDARSSVSIIPVTPSGNPTRQVAPFTEEES